MVSLKDNEVKEGKKDVKVNARGIIMINHKTKWVGRKQKIQVEKNNAKVVRSVGPSGQRTANIQEY